MREVSEPESSTIAPAGMSTQCIFDFVQMCLLIVNQSRSSKVPPMSACWAGRRSAVMPTVVPQREQNCSRSQRPLSSDLCSNIFGGEPVNSTFSAGKNTSIPKAPPVRRWQKVQWHTIASRGNPRTRYRTSRQRQPPSWKSVIAPPETRKYQHCTLLALHAMRSCANGWSAYPPRLSVNADIVAEPGSAMSGRA